MLAISPLRSHKEDNRHGGGHNTEVIGGEGIEFDDFYDGDLLESIIDFDDIFIDGDGLPDLEVDPEFLGEAAGALERGFDECNNAGELLLREQERDASGVVIPKECVKTRKSSSSSGHHSKNNSNPQGGKRKVKVDWTPELHRKFVQAVEQLGVDKAVPSRILEIMGIDCLTRHNIASHLQKYRSHRKHLLAREAEASTWSQRRHLYSTTGNNKQRQDATGTTSPWLAASATIIGFPPPMTPPHPVHPHFRPLHVWGHPSVDQSLALPYIWPKHLSQPRPSPGWVSAIPPHHAPWHPPPPPQPQPQQRLPLSGGSLTQGTPCYPQTLQPTRFAPAPTTFAGFTPHAAGFGVPMLPGQSAAAPPLDLLPSKETIDAVIGDALTKPWLPFPLGLKPPSLDGVLGELHRHGVPDIPPSSSSSS